MAGLKPQRLRKRRDFLAAASGRRFHTERMTAQSRLRGAEESRDGALAMGLYVGLTITKRVGHATERNRIRRRLRRAIEIAAATAPSPEADLVLIARRPALDACFETLVDDVTRAFASITRPSKSKPNSIGGRSPTKPEQPRAPRGTTDG